MNIKFPAMIKRSAGLAVGMAALVTAARIAAATVDFATTPVTGFNNTSQISTAGGLVDAAHFGNDAAADILANGVLFVSRGSSSPNLAVGTTGTARTYSNTTIYTASTHAAGYTAITGLSATDADLMFDSIAYGDGIGNSLVTLSGLTIGHNYQFQLFLVRDMDGANNLYLSQNPLVSHIGPFNWSQNAVQLITGTFTADAATQTFRVYVGGDNYAWVNAYQLRDLSYTPPVNDPLLQVSAFSASHDGTPLAISIPISNLGATQNLEISTVTPGGPAAASFVVDSFTSSLLPGGSGTIEMTFTPAAGGLYQATLTIASNDANQPSIEVALQVTVLDPVVAVAPPAIDYGNLLPAPAPQTVDLTIANHGTTRDLTLDNFQFTGPDAANFAVGSHPLSVGPGLNTNVGVTFTAGSGEGNFVASLVITTNDPVQPTITVPLTAVVKLADPDASLRSHFTFDNPVNVAEDTGSFHHDGTPVGDAQRTTDSHVGSGALLLDGDGDLVDVGNGADYTSGLTANGEGFTVACWANIPVDSTNNRSRFFSAYMPGGFVTEGWGVGHYTAGQLIGTSYGHYDYLSGAAAAPARGDWHHFAYVFRNVPLNRVDFYVDGALAGSSSALAGINYATSVGFAIGAIGIPGVTQYFAGRIDDLRIYDRELVAANIADIYQNVSPPSAYDTWALSFGLDPAGNGAPVQDADADGLLNSLEFVLGTSPASGTQANLPVSQRIGNTFTFVYRRQIAATAAGFAEVVEHGGDLATWAAAIDGQDGVTIAVAVIDAATEEVTVTIPVTVGNSHFARLRVIPPVQ